MSGSHNVGCASPLKSLLLTLFWLNPRLYYLVLEHINFFEAGYESWLVTVQDVDDLSAYAIAFYVHRDKGSRMAFSRYLVCGGTRVTGQFRDPVVR